MVSGQHLQNNYKDELKLVTKQLMALKKRKEVLDDFKARAHARAMKNNAAKAKAKAKRKAKAKAKRKYKAIAKATSKTHTNVYVLTDAIAVL